MNDLQKELQELKAKVADLESRISDKPVAKWQPTGGDFFIQSNGKMSKVVGGSDNLHKEFGVERQTKEQAERAAVEMRRFNRLLALRDELCGDDVVNWTDNEWTTGKNQYMQYVGVYFANEASAQKACDMLNSGEVEL